jgi:NAD(P)-dependent dehydrogenase (short-subunit alcohol dehydrogenase family)
MQHLTNHVVIVTGAASGIGQQVAIQAVECGGYVIATDRNSEGLSATAQSVGKDRIETHVLDVSQPDEIAAFAKQIIPMLDGRPLVLINNAGVALDCGSFSNTTLEDFEWLLSINLWGVIRMTKSFLPYLLQQNSGHIVNISSVFGLAGIADQSAYCTAKFGVRGFTETLRMELFDTNVKTLCVHPGGIKTNIASAARIGGEVTEEIHQKNSVAFNENLAITTSQEAARQILEAIRKDKKKLVIGKDGRQIDFITRLMPIGYTKIFKKMLDAAKPK